MLYSEFSKYTDIDDMDVYKRANEIYMSLPNLNKQDFCLLWYLYGENLAHFKMARGLLHCPIALRAETARFLREDITDTMRDLANAARFEMQMPKHWSRQQLFEIQHALEIEDELNHTPMETP